MLSKPSPFNGKTKIGEIDVYVRDGVHDILYLNVNVVLS